MEGGRAAVDAGRRHRGTAGQAGRRRVLVHPSGFVQSPYTDIAPAGESPRSIPQRYADNPVMAFHVDNVTATATRECFLYGLSA